MAASMFKTRVITASLLLPLFVGGMFWLGSGWWAIALLPLVLAGAWEWGALAGYGRLSRWVYCGFVLASGLTVLLAGHHWHMLALEKTVLWASTLFWFICAPLWLWTGWKPRNPFSFFVAGWILLVPTWIAMVRLQSAPWVLLSVLGVIWVADSAAYFAGRNWGRHKLASTISPGKTWEGVFGGGVAVAVYYLLVWNFGLAAQSPASGLAAALLVAVLFPLSILGDLFESCIKRQAGVKDSGKLLPGHGGVLDRIDALTSTLPLAALVIPWMMTRS